MTLKERFNNALDLDNDKYITYECEEIAEEFAIEFAEWCCARAIGVTHFKLNEEELEQFKKEKGL